MASWRHTIHLEDVFRDEFYDWADEARVWVATF